MTLTERVLAAFGPEDCEQYTVVQWLDYLIAIGHPLKYTAIPNATFTKSVMQRKRNELLGLRPGLSDLLIAYRGRWLVFVEMKQTGKSKTTTDQKAWVEFLRTIPNVEAHVCKGADKAMAVLQPLLPPLPAQPKRTDEVLF